MIFYRLKFKEIRKKQRWSIEALGKAAKISRQSISKWENGKGIPAEHMVRKLAEVLNISESDISNIQTKHPVSRINLSETIASNPLLASEDIDKPNTKITDIRNSLTELEQNLKETSMILKSVLLHTIDITYIKDPNQKYVIANKAFLENLSLDSNFIVEGKEDNDFFSKKEAKENFLNDEQVLKFGKPSFGKEGIIPGSKKKKWGIFTRIPMMDDNNRIIGLLCKIVDITEKENNERNNKILRFALSKLNEIFWIAKGVNHATDVPTLYKELIYSFTPKEIPKEAKDFWGNINLNDLDNNEIRRIWEGGMCKKTKEYLIKLKMEMQFPVKRQYNLTSPITNKEVWVTEYIDFDKESESYVGKISFGHDDIKLSLLKEITNKTPNLIVWIGNRCNSEKEFRYQYLSDTEKITGYKTSYFKNSKIIFMDLVSDKKEKDKIIDHFIRDDLPFSYEYKIKKRTGEERLIRSFYYKIGEESIFTQTFYGFHIDVTM